MRFSIIIPAYNAELTLKKCIDSILKQTYKDYEVIIINDGSTDNTQNIINHYSNNHCNIRVIHKKNQGVSSARNVGISLANGDYILFIDADDYIDTDYLYQLSISNSDIIVCGYRSFGGANNEESPSEHKIYRGDKLKDHLLSNIDKSFFRTPWCKAFNKKLLAINNIRFDERIKFGEDTEFNFKVIRYAQTLETINYIGYNYCYGNPYAKWIILPKQYKYSIQRLLLSLSELKCKSSEIAEKDLINCFMVFFFIGLWNTNFKKSVSLSVGYFRHNLCKYMPYKGWGKVKKLISIILIPYINIFRKVKYE